MADFAALSPLASGVTSQNAPHATPAPAVPPVEAALRGQASGGQMSQGNGNGAQGGQPDRPPMAKLHPRPDPHALTGPSPAFQARVLDLEKDLTQIIARLETARSLQEASRITAAPATAPAPRTTATPDGQFPNPDAESSSQDKHVPLDTAAQKGAGERQ